MASVSRQAEVQPVDHIEKFCRELKLARFAQKLQMSIFLREKFQVTDLWAAQHTVPPLAESP